MPISSDSILQSKTGTLTGAGPASIVFDNPTTADSVIFICGFASNDSTGVGFSTPTGGTGSFFEASSGASGGGSRGRYVAYAKRHAAASETTYSMELTGTPGLAVWAAYEIADTGSNAPDFVNADYFINNTSGVTAATSLTQLSSGVSGYVPTTVESTIDAYNALGCAIFCAENPGATIPTFSNLDIDGATVEMQTYTDVTLSNGTYSIAMKVCFPALYEVGRYKVSADVSPSSYVATDFICFYANDSKMTQKFDVICGFEWGTMTGVTAGSAVAPGTAPLDFVNGSPEIQSAIKRSGNYAAKLSSTSAIENFGWLESTGALAVFHPVSQTHSEVKRFHFYFDGALPTTDVEIAFIEAGTLANGLRMWFRAASGKIALKVGSGSDNLSDAAISHSKWVGVDVRYSPDSTTHYVDWSVHYDSLGVVDPVVQTSFTKSSQTAADPGPRVGYGWNDATTATMYVDDIAISKQYGTYPVGDIRVVGITVDGTGTPSVVGTSSNFATFANNSDINAWNPVTARNALREIPPAVGPTADGVTQITVAANDYMTFPMETFTCAPLYSPRALRWHVAGWAKSANPATLRVLSNDGSANVFNVAVGDHGFDDTNLAWLCGMQRKKPAGIAAHYPLNQSHLDNLELRVGYSDDANPDVGVHAIIAEVCYAPAKVFSSSSGEGFTTFVRQDGVTGAIVSYLITTPPDKGGTFTITKDGVTTPYPVPKDYAWTLSVGAASIETVTYVGFSPDS